MEDAREKFIHSRYFKSLNDDISLLYRHTGHCLDNYGDILEDDLEQAMRGIYKALEDYASVKKKDNTGSKGGLQDGEQEKGGILCKSEYRGGGTA